LFREYIQTEDWDGDILGLVDSDTYLNDVKTALEEQEVNITFDNPNSNEVNPIRDILKANKLAPNKKKEEAPKKQEPVKEKKNILVKPKTTKQSDQILRTNL